MPRRKSNPDAPFMSISGTSYKTGLSTSYLRACCRAGTIPFIKVGADYRINVPALMAQLEKASTENTQGVSDCV